MKFTTIGVIGVGTIGCGVVADLVLHAIDVVAVDVSDDALQRARAAILEATRFAPLLEKNAPRLSPAQVLARITFTTRLEDLATCQFIVENATECWSVKRPIYERIDAIAGADVCFGANTSCLSITRLGGATQRPDRVVGLHFMNPVHLKPAVEVIRGHHTSDATLAAVHGLFTQLGKEAIVVGDLPGFVSNRISHLFMNEAAFVFQDGLAAPEQIDAIFRKCFGHKMGPLETADLIGLDTVMHSLDVLHDSFHDPKFRCCPVLRKMVDAGLCGRKSGRGFYVYPSAVHAPAGTPLS